MKRIICLLIFSFIFASTTYADISKETDARIGKIMQENQTINTNIVAYSNEIQRLNRILMENDGRIKELRKIHQETEAREAIETKEAKEAQEVNAKAEAIVKEAEVVEEVEE